MTTDTREPTGVRITTVRNKNGKVTFFMHPTAKGKNDRHTAIKTTKQKPFRTSDPTVIGEAVLKILKIKT